MVIYAMMLSIQMNRFTMKRYLFLALLLSTSAGFAYQTEGDYFDLNIGTMAGKIGETNSTVVDSSKHYNQFFWQIGFGKVSNATNSISWQQGFSYYQINPITTQGTLAGSSYSYNTQTSGIWYNNLFHFDVFTGSLTPIQPYLGIMIGVAKNYASNFVNANVDLGSKSNYQFAYGAEAGLSYQLDSMQIISVGINHSELGQSQIGHVPGSTGTLPSNRIALTGIGLHYTVVF